MSRLKSVDQETIRILNQKKILNLLYRNNKLTKQEISQKLNISIPTVISNSNELIEEGFWRKLELQSQLAAGSLRFSNSCQTADILLECGLQKIR
ncbi:winged helix-turn-helix domain-containing protein [Clostridium ljungdahlii]|uniref:winged helix-turn-helix domain-containing protein n=1 Tax=Clostridium ljungdahlii TaxID=1538 RepID=UPI003863EAF3